MGERRKKRLVSVGSVTLWHVEALATALGLAGATLNALHQVEGFYLWLVANALWVWFAFRLRRWGLLAMFTVYFVMSVVGIVVWTAK